MPEAQDTGFITQAQYDHYSADWVALLERGDDDELTQAFQRQETERINFLTFSIDQILALVSAANVHLIKARFLLVPAAAGQAYFAATLFAIDVDGHRLSEYYTPTQATALTTQAIEPSAELSTQIPPKTALAWLTGWVAADSLTTALFTTANGPLHGFNFEVSTFKDPLAGAQPYGDQCLFLNLGLNPDVESTLAALVVYVSRIGSRTQGSLEGIPSGDVFYDVGSSCPPSS